MNEDTGETEIVGHISPTNLHFPDDEQQRLAKYNKLDIPEEVRTAFEESIKKAKQ